MYLIALCDDETEELNKIEQMLCNYKKRHPEIDFVVDCFENPDKLLDMVSEENYVPDLIFMDIYMPERMGIEVARELRDIGNISGIVFVTTSKEHALEAFGVNAVQYLVKPLLEKDLFPMLDRFFYNVKEERKKYLLLRIEGRIQRVGLSNIVYFEAHGKTQCLYLADGTQYQQYVTMTKIYEMLADYQEFVRVGAAYIVNLEHVDSMNARELQFDNGNKIYLPRGSYQTLRERYFDYYCEGDNM
ncbi:MAG: LytTR family DNA-binding domain-containing protein [Lachnospiraceae bacterium]|nr:LytTR family DNA-binding domain-containing protein [Lachnospiraceae bacterium]